MVSADSQLIGFFTCGCLEKKKEEKADGTQLRCKLLLKLPDNILSQK